MRYKKKYKTQRKQQTTVNQMNKISFSSFLRNFDRDFYEKIERELMPQLSKKAFDTALSTNIETLGGKVFYYMFKIISQNFDEDCIKGFDRVIKSKRQEYLSKHTPVVRKINNAKESFINQFIIQQYDVADKASIEAPRLSKVLKNTLSDFYAFEVIAIAITNDMKPKAAFEQLYITPLTDDDILKKPKTSKKGKPTE